MALGYWKIQKLDAVVYLHLCLIERIIDPAAFSNATQWQPCIGRCCRVFCSPVDSCSGQSVPSPPLLATGVWSMQPGHDDNLVPQDCLSFRHKGHFKAEATSKRLVTPLQGSGAFLLVAVIPWLIGISIMAQRRRVPAVAQGTVPCTSRGKNHWSW